MYERTLLGELSKCAWNVTSAFLKVAVPVQNQLTSSTAETMAMYRAAVVMRPEDQRVCDAFLDNGTFLFKTDSEATNKLTLKR